MSREGLIFALLALLVLGAAGYFLVQDDRGELPPRRDGRRSPFASEDDDPLGGTPRRTTRAPTASSTTTRPQPPKDLSRLNSAPTVETVDVFGRPESALHVLVNGPNDQPFPGARVELHRHHRGPGTVPTRGELLSGGVTDAEGAYRVDGLDAFDAYELIVSSPGLRRFRIVPLRLEPGRRKVQLVHLGQGLAVTGTVVGESGEPIAGAVVRAYDLTDTTGDPEGTREAEAKTGPDGKFELVALCSGPKRFTATARGYGSATKPYVPLGTGAASLTEVDFELGRGMAISGTVRMIDGATLPGAFIRVRPVHGQAPGVSQSYYPEVSSDSKGNYQVDGLQEGLYFVSATKEGYIQGHFGGLGARRQASVMNAKAGDVGVDLYLDTAPIVRGRVIDRETGEPIKAFDLYPSGAQDPLALDNRHRQRFNDANGEFEAAIPVTGARTRYVWIHAQAPGYASGKVQVDFADDGTMARPLLKEVDGVEIQMDRGGSFVGRVLDSNGRPLAGATISARRMRNPKNTPNAPLVGSPLLQEQQVFSRSGKSNDKGRFELDRLGEGRYRIEIVHRDHAPFFRRDQIDFEGLGEFDLGTTRLQIGGTVFGQVLEEEGEGPEEGARVSLISSLGLEGPSFDFRTGGSGAFIFEHVPAGSYRLVVTERDGLDTRSAYYQELKGRKPVEIAITVENGSRQSFELDG